MSATAPATQRQVPIEWYSPRSFTIAPRIIETTDAVPKSVRENQERAFFLYWSDARSAANASRTAVERLMDELNVPTDLRIGTTRWWTSLRNSRNASW